MAKIQEASPQVPPLPIGCVDADALEAACRAGKTPEEILKAAVVINDEATAAPEPAPAPETGAVEEGAA